MSLDNYFIMSSQLDMTYRPFEKSAIFKQNEVINVFCLHMPPVLNMTYAWETSKNVENTKGKHHRAKMYCVSLRNKNSQCGRKCGWNNTVMYSKEYKGLYVENSGGRIEDKLHVKDMTKIWEGKDNQD